MVAEKYSILKHDIEEMIVPGGPIIVKAKAITRNNVDRTLLIQCKFQNISDKTINGMRIKIRIKDLYDKAETFDFDYTFVNARKLELFGSDTPIPVSSESASSVDVFIEKVVFDDNTEWTNCDKKELVKIPSRKLVSSKLDNDLYQYYRKEIGKYTQANVAYIPFESFGAVFCGCGCTYRESFEKCPVCGMSYEEQKHIQDPQILKQCIIDEKELNAQKEKERIEEKRAKKERAGLFFKKNPILVVLVGIIVVVGVIFALICGITEVRKIHNPLLLKSIEISSPNVVDNNTCYFEITADTKESIGVVLATSLEDDEPLDIVYVEDGAGAFRCNYDKENVIQPVAVGYLTGTTIDKESVTCSYTENLSDGFAYANLELDFTVSDITKQNGLLFYSVYDAESQLIDYDFVDIVDGLGDSLFHFTTDGNCDAEMYDVFYIVPEFFVPTTTENMQYRSIGTILGEEIDNSYSYVEEYKGSQPFEISGLPSQISSIDKIIIYKDKNLNNYTETYNIAISDKNYFNAKFYDLYVPSRNKTYNPLNREFIPISVIPIWSIEE